MNGSFTADQVEREIQSPGESTAGETHKREIDPLTVTQRLQREGRWYGQIEHERDEMMKLNKKAIPDKRERQIFVYSELDRLYPPLPKEDTVLFGDAEVQNRTVSGRGDDGQIQGLSKMPDAWPELPANASLSAEVAWVQANRLRIVEESPGHATIVDLKQAMSSAPSWSALGWLETSIRSYAKFVDVAAKATASDDGEAEVWRRERMAIDEVKALLDEMIEAEDGPCPRCGRSD